MVKSKKITTLTLILCFLLKSVLVSTPDFSVSLELADIHYIKNKKGEIKPTAFIGEPFKLKLIVSGKKHSSETTKIKGLKNFKQMEKSHQSSVSINGSEVAVEKTTLYSLIPTKEGEFKFETTRAKPVTINIEKQSQRENLKLTSNPKASIEKAPELFCKLISNKKTAVTEEPIEITLKICYSGNIANISLTQIPNFTDCTVKEVKKTKEYLKNMKGKTYSVIEKKFMIFPGKAGALEISPAQIAYSFRKKRKRKRGLGFLDDSFFSGFFGTHLKQKIAISNPLQIKVEKLPENNKKTDGIGTFSAFKATTNKTDVHVNEPITLKLALNGKANFDLILQPKLSLPKSFKSYDSKTINNQNEKVFEFILQVPKAGDWTIPSQKFTYFDIKEKNYKTIETESIKLKATIPEGEKSAPKISVDKQENITENQDPAVTDIHFIQEDAPDTTQNTTKKKQKSFPIWILFLLIFMVPLLVFIKKLSFIFSPIYKRFFASKNTFSKYQAKLNKIIEFNEPEKLYNLFIHFLAKSYDIPASNVREKWIKNKLNKNGLSEEKTSSFIKFLNECAKYSFASEKVPTDALEDFAKKAKYWMIIIKRTLP